MGQKIHPIGLRLGINRTWSSRWYAEPKDYPRLVVEDDKVRRFVKKKLFNAGISKIDIERKAEELKINLTTAKPGMVVGRGGAGTESLKKELAELTGKKVEINVIEVERIEADAQLVAESIAAQIEKRIAFRRAMKQAIQRSMKAGAKGIKVMIAGRLGGAEIARTEWQREGRIPLHTLRADIDYGVTEARTVAGIIGVKVWIFHGEILPGSDVYDRPVARPRREREERRPRPSAPREVKPEAKDGDE